MTLRRISVEDLHVRVEWMNNPHIYQSMHYEVPVNLEKTLQWYTKNADSSSRFDAVFEEQGQIVAMGGLTGIDPILNKAELYIFVDPDLHSKGTGTRATRLLCRYGFESLGLAKIVLVTNDSNIGAQKVYEKVGFSLEGKMRREAVVNNRFEDRLYYGMFKEELIID